MSVVIISRCHEVFHLIKYYKCQNVSLCLLLYVGMASNLYKISPINNGRKLVHIFKEPVFCLFTKAGAERSVPRS